VLNCTSINKERFMSIIATKSNVALWVRREAKPGREEEVEAFLREGLKLVEEEPGTLAWFALKLGPTTYGIFDTFPADDERQAHLAGNVAAALKMKAEDLFSQPPAIVKVDVVAEKLPN
jgi:quinol monooxygenase YgiN